MISCTIQTPTGSAIARVELTSVAANGPSTGFRIVFVAIISSGITIIVLMVTWLVVRRGMRPLERMGACFHFTGVRMQPGKPLVFGELSAGTGTPVTAS